MALAEVRVSLLWLWPSQTSAMALCSPVPEVTQLIQQIFHSCAAQRFRQILLKQLPDENHQSSGLFLELSEYSSWVPGAESSQVWHSHTARLLCLEFRGKWGSFPLTYSIAASSLFPRAELSQSWSWGSSFLKFTLCHFCVLSDRIDSAGAAALLMFPFMFMFVPTEWPLAQTTWTCITRKLTTLEPPVCHYPS